MLKIFLAAWFCLLGLQLAQAESLVFKETSFPCHRLPLNVRPTHYDVQLKFPSLESDDYEGHVNISLKFVAANQADKFGPKKSREENDIAKSVQGTECSLLGDNNRIVLHADERLDIQDIIIRTDVQLNFLFNGAQRDRAIVELVRDRTKQMIGIKINRGTFAGANGKMSISFKGKMRNDLRGVYVSTYKDGDKVYRHAVSQFQATDARTAFPCFDEPRFKVPFDLSIIHRPNQVAYGNADVKSVVMDEINSMATTTFETTPKMPVHMVGFAVGEFDKPLETVSEYKRNGTSIMRKVRVITAPGKQHTAHFALDVLKRSLEWFEDYIDFQYPLSKLDIIAIADHERGNTETWGIGFVRDNLIWIDYETKPDTKITTAVNVAHIAVHQWFANLINAAWWPDLWITEGVAAQFSFRIVDELYKDLQSEYFLRLATLAGVMQLDQAGTSHALSPPLGRMRTIDEIDQIFDKIEFMKSGSLGQLCMDVAGPSLYQSTLRRLIAENAFGAVNFDDYIRALTDNGRLNGDQIVKMLRTFADYQGVPLVNVAMGGRLREGVQLSLERFDQAKKTLTDYTEQKPTQELTLYTTLTVAPTNHNVFISSDKNELIMKKFMEPLRSQHVVGDTYILINRWPTLGAYYRTRYSDELYYRLSVAIRMRKIEPMSRIQILDDANNLVQAQLITNDTFKGLLDSYANENHGAVILQMLLATKTLLSLKTTDTRPPHSIEAFLNLFKKFGFQVTGSETVMMQRARQATLTALVKRGNQEVIGEALHAFERANGNVALFLREPVYTAVVLANSRYVDRLLNKLANTKSYEEKIRLITALALSDDKHTLAELQTWLSSSDLKEETIAPFVKSVCEKLTK